MQESVVPKQKQKRLVLVDTRWYWVSMKRYWLIYDGTGSVWGSSGCYLVVLGQYNLVSSGTGLVKGFYACIY